MPDRPDERVGTGAGTRAGQSPGRRLADRRAGLSDPRSGAAPPARAPAAPEASRAPGWRTGVREAFAGTSRLFLLVLAIYAGSRVAPLGPRAARLLDSALVVALFLQGAVWASRIVVGWVSWYAARKAAESAAVANALSIIQLFARTAVWAMALEILHNLGFNVTTLVAGLGIGGIAIALAAQNVLGDLFASLRDRARPARSWSATSSPSTTVWARSSASGSRPRACAASRARSWVCSGLPILLSRAGSATTSGWPSAASSLRSAIRYSTTAERLERLPAILRAIVEDEAVGSSAPLQVRRYRSDLRGRLLDARSSYNRFMDVPANDQPSDLVPASDGGSSSASPIPPAPPLQPQPPALAKPT